MISFQNPFDSAEPAGHPAKKEKTDYIIHKVIQALNILEQFHDEVDELSLTEMSRRLGMQESSVNLLLATLKTRNYIEQNGVTKNYRLGFKNLELAQTVLRQTDLYRVSHPVLSSVALECGETTAVAVLRKSHVIELDAVHSEHPVRVIPRVGVHLPVHCTAAGKALIAHLADEALTGLLKGGALERHTPNTITGAEELRLQLQLIAANGYAVDDQELDRDVRGVAAAIRDYSGHVVGAVVITGPSCRISLERLDAELVPLVQRGAREISAKLGYHEAGQPPGPVRGSETAVRRSASPRPAAPKRKPAGTNRAA
jgi:DNA-binding IclR family transcriptional regulator